MKKYNDIKKIRARAFYNNDYKINLKRCNTWHYLLLPLLSFLRIINGQKIHIVGDKRIFNKSPKIYACTHIGFYDIMILFEVIKSPCWLFLGNPEDIINTLYGKMVIRNGVVFVDTYDKEDRKIAKSISESLLKLGGSLMIFPEGAWNVTDNEIVMKLFRGTVEMAFNTGAEIIPVAIEQYKKDFYVNIGKNITYEGEIKDVEHLNTELRDILSSLKWEIWEQYPFEERQNIDSSYKKRWINEILQEGGRQLYI